MRLADAYASGVAFSRCLAHGTVIDRCCILAAPVKPIPFLVPAIRAHGPRPRLAPVRSRHPRQSGTR